MKWSIQQLQKLTNSPFHFEEELDFSEYACKVEDIISINPAYLSGTITKISIDKFRVQYHIDVLIIVQCALTLDPVDYHYVKDFDEIFSVNPTDDEYLIEKNTLDLGLAVWSNILFDKPLSVTREDAYDILKKRGIVLNESFDDIED